MLSSFPIQASIPTKDINRSRQFYEGVLGFTPHEINDAGVVYLSGGIRFLLYVTFSSVIPEHTLFTWMVDDVYPVVEELRSRGVVFEEYDYPDMKTVNGIASLGTERVAWFKDPAGNVFAIGSR